MRTICRHKCERFTGKLLPSAHLSSLCFRLDVVVCRVRSLCNCVFTSHVGHRRTNASHRRSFSSFVKWMHVPLINIVRPFCHTFFGKCLSTLTTRFSDRKTIVENVVLQNTRFGRNSQTMRAINLVHMWNGHCSVLNNMNFVLCSCSICLDTQPKHQKIKWKIGKNWFSMNENGYCGKIVFVLRAKITYSWNSIWISRFSLSSAKTIYGFKHCVCEIISREAKTNVELIAENALCESTRRLRCCKNHALVQFSSST